MATRWSSLLSFSLVTNLAFSAPIVQNQRLAVSYRGGSVDGVEHYQNIFYAKDTSGANRFASPILYTPPPGTTVDATTAGAWCPQGLGGPPLPFTSLVSNVSENCLSLRIARPSGTRATAKLPVLVWIHGGGDALGSASDLLYTPDGLVKQAKSNGQPVIYVGINYRLGVFGYAASKALTEAKQTNVGLRDQRVALEWVRDNIEAFGGDSNNVVAVGQSVGAMAIGLHLVSYSGKRGVPFQKAVMMSGGTGTNFNIMSDFVASNTAKAAQSVGCLGDPDSPGTLDCLRKVPFEKLMNYSVALARQQHPPFGELVFYPSYDGDYIPDRPSVLLRKGIPIIGSWTANDGAWYVQPQIEDDESVLESFTAYIHNLSKLSLQRLLSLYPLADFQPLVNPEVKATAQYYRAAQMHRDLWFTCPVIDFTWQYARFGGDGDIYLFEMNQTKFGPIFQYMSVPQWHVSHLSNIPYLMNEDVIAGGDNSAAQRDLSMLLSGSVAAFAHSGDPAVSRARTFKDWPTAYSYDGRRVLSNEYPSKLNLYVVGGPYGSGSAHVDSKAGAIGKSEAEKVLTRQKLIERCQFINSIHDEIGV